jgi:hypothetical protein
MDELAVQNLGESDFLGGKFGQSFGDLIKALQASGQGGSDGRAIIPEDLEVEAYSVLWRDGHLKLLRQLPIIRARAITHEYTQITDYTGVDTEGFMRDGGTPNSYEFASQRNTEQIRPIGERSSVTGMMAAVDVIRALGASDAISIQRTTKLLGLQQKMIRALYFANTLGLGATSTTKFRGMEQIITEDSDAANIINATGNTVRQDDFDSAAAAVVDSFGELTHINMANKALQNYGKTIANVRNVQGIAQNITGAGYAGVRINAVRHAFGESELVGDTFLGPKYSRYKHAPVYTTPKNPKPENAPSQPAIILDAKLTVGADAASEFTATDAAEFGTYYYAFTADNTHDVSKDKTGESEARFAGTGGAATGQAVAAGEAVTIELVATPVTGVSSYRVYRAIKSSSAEADFQFIGEVAQAGAGATTFKDLNTVISHTKDSAGIVEPTTVAFGLTLPTFRDVTKAGAQMKLQYPVDTPDAVKRVDLSAIFPRAQAIIGDVASDELLLWYGAIEIPYPNRVVLIKNIGNRNL